MRRHRHDRSAPSLTSAGRQPRNKRTARRNIHRRRLGAEFLEERALLAVLQLDGVNDYVTAPDSASLDLGVGQTDDFTIEALFYVSDLSDVSNQALVNKVAAYSLYAAFRTDQLDQLLFRIDKIDGASLTMAALIDLDVGWHHVAAVFDNEWTLDQDRMAVFVDGNLESQTTNLELTPGLKNSITALDVGARSSTDSLFKGQIDEVRLSDTVRYSGETYSLPAGPFGSDANTRAIWQFDEPPGATSFADASPHGNTLTGFNGAQTTSLTVTWTGGSPTDDLWSNPANWDADLGPGVLPRVPMDGDDVTIPATAESFEVVFDASVAGGGVTLKSLDCAEPFRIGEGSLTLLGTGNFGFSAGLTMNGGAILGINGATISGGAFNWNGGTLGGTGTVRIEGGLTAGGATKTLSGRTLELASNTVWAGGTILLENQGAINNLAGSVFDIQGNLLLDDGSAATTEAFNNQGTIVKSAGSISATIETQFTNAGTLRVEQGTLALTGELTNYDEATGTLSGGRYEVVDVGGTLARLRWPNNNLIVNDADILLRGPNASITDISLNDALDTLSRVTPAGRLTLEGLASVSLGGGSALVNSFNANTGQVVGIAVDDASGNVFVYGTSDPDIREFSPTGVAVPPNIPRPGAASDDFDLDFLTEALTINGVSVPANSLLVFNGDDAPETVRAIDKNTGTVLATLNITNAGASVGGAYHPGRNTFFIVEWDTDLIREIDPATGAVLNSFPVRPGGSPSFSVFFGDVEVDGATGNLLVVGSGQSRIRLLSPTGQFLGDIDVGALPGISISISGIALNEASDELWLTTSIGNVFHLRPLQFENEGTVIVRNSTVRVLGPRGYSQIAGTTTLDGGTIIVNTGLELEGGTLDGSGSVVGDVLNHGGTVSPGRSAGVLIVANDYQQGGFTTLEIELSTGGSFDQLNVLGDAVLDGTLGVSLLNGLVPVVGQSFAIIPNSASVSGGFNVILGGDLGNGLFLDPNYRANGFDLIADLLEVGPDRTVDEGQSVLLSAQFGDPGSIDAHTATIDWGDGLVEAGAVADGTAAGNSISGSHAYTNNGVYVVTVRLLSSLGAQATASFQVTVENAAPSADAGGPYAVQEGGTVQLAGSGTDPGLDALTFHWDLDGDGVFDETGAAAARGNETGVAPTFNAATLDGPVFAMVTLRVDDEDGGVATDTAMISIANAPPVAEAGGPYSVIENATVLLSGSGADVVGDPLTFTWDLDGDGVFGETGAAALRGNETGAMVTFNAAGLDGPSSVTVALRADDAEGGIATDTATINIFNAPPTAEAGGPYSVPEGGTVMLSGTGTDVPGDFLTFTWDLDGDGVFGETGTAALRGDETGAMPTFNAAGLDGPSAVTVTLRVNDGEGGISTDTATINVSNVSPTADAGGPYTVPEGGTVVLSGTGMDVPGDPLTFTWDLDGDGVFGEGAAAPGVFQFRPDQGGNGHFYQLVYTDAPRAWTDARAAAAARQHLGQPGYLATVTTQEENEFLRTSFQATMRSFRDFAWIGLTDEVVEGDYRWITGEPFTFSNWRPGEPNNSGDEDYVHYQAGTAAGSAGWGWNDLRNNHSAGPIGYLVEYDAPQGPIYEEIGPMPTFNAADLDGPATVTVSMRVADGDGGVTTVTTTIDITNTPPTIDAGGPYTVAQGAAVMLSGSGSDVPSDPLVFDWDLDGDGIFGETGAAAAANGQELGLTPTFNSTGRPAGQVTVAFRASDDDGGITIDTATINIQGPLGPEFRVNTFVNGGQWIPSVAMDDEGDFIVAWRSGLQDGDGNGVYAQRYNAAGLPEGNEFRVNTFTTSFQDHPSVAMDADGDFVVAWGSYLQDGGFWGVYAQRYNAAGTPQGSEFRVNTFTANSQSQVSVAMNADGDFVIVWESSLQDGSGGGIYAQRYSAAGVPQGGEFRANTFTTNDQQRCTVAMAADGDFVIAWESQGQGHSIYAQRYNAAGVRQGSEFRVSMTSSGSFPSAAIDDDGDFVIAWHSTAGNDRGIFAQRYNAAGMPQGGQFQVDTFTAGSQSDAIVAMDADGDFVIAWESGGQDGSYDGIYAQRFSAAGVPQGGEFRVNTFTFNPQDYPSAAMDADGNFVIAWSSAHEFGFGVYAQRFSHDANFGPVLILDDGDIGYAQTGDWNSTCGLGHNNDVSLALMGAGTPGVASWTFNVPQPGQYRISATWIGNPDLLASNAPFSVIDGATPRGTVLMNQKLVRDDVIDGGAAWENIGVFNITGSTVAVQLTPVGADGYVIADAIRIERVGDLLNTPEIQVTEGLQDVPDESGVIDYGIVELNRPRSKTFTIANTGLQPLHLTLPISVPPGYTLVSPPLLTTLNSGQSTTFVVRLTAALPGTYAGQVSFGTDDSDENPFNFNLTGTVLATRILDDGDPGVGFQNNYWGMYDGGLGRGGDFRYARDVSGGEIVNWNFTVTPGQYRVSATWFGGSPFYDGTAQFFLSDSGTKRGGKDLDQQSSPDDRLVDGSWFEDVGVFNIHGSTLTVTLWADDPLLYVLADAILIERLGDVPSGPEIAVFRGSRDVNAGQPVDFGPTQANHPVEATFAITNSGTSALAITGPITVPDGYELHIGPSQTTLNPGEISWFTVRLTATTPGIKAGAVIIPTNDADENPFNFNITGTVLATQILDDDPSSPNPGYFHTGDFQSVPLSIARDGDVSYVHFQAAPSQATWTFTVTPGQYRIAATWFDTAGNVAFADNSPFTILDGATPLETILVNQRQSPDDFTDSGSSWEFLGGAINVTATTLTVRLSNIGTNGYVLADAIRIERIGPAGGNGELLSSLLAHASDSADSEAQSAVPSDGLTSDEQRQASVRDEALTTTVNGRQDAYTTESEAMATAYWNDELEDLATLLAEDPGRQDSDEPLSELTAVGGPSRPEKDRFDLALADRLLTLSF